VRPHAQQCAGTPAALSCTQMLVATCRDWLHRCRHHRPAVRLCVCVSIAPLSSRAVAVSAVSVSGLAVRIVAHRHPRLMVRCGAATISTPLTECTWGLISQPASSAAQRGEKGRQRKQTTTTATSCNTADRGGRWMKIAALFETAFLDNMWLSYSFKSKIVLRASNSMSIDSN